MRSDFHEMTARIEALLAGRSEDPDASARSFRWEAVADGTIHWVEGIPRAAVIGRTIGTPAEGGGEGADPRIAAAVRQRAPFRDAPFAIGGDGVASGRWRMAGVPVFDSATGQFRGYRGSASRERAGRAGGLAADPAAAVAGHGSAPSDSVRQLVHELRTPLTAIVGFAEMIDGQHLGPAGAGYRARAAGIRQQAARLLSAVEDLDLAARAEAAPSGEAKETDLALLLEAVENRLSRAAGEGGWPLRIEIVPALPPVRLDGEVAERLLTRLLGGLAAATEAGEILPAWLGHDAGRDALVFRIGRPRRLAASTDAELLDPDLDLAAGNGGAPLGLGFALRLVRRIAESVGGALELRPDHLSLVLPLAGSENADG